MNYRHSFHAGNFADLVKHAVLLGLLETALADPAPLTVVDTHAGAGLYDLSDPGAARSREAEAGVKRLMAGGAPPALTPLAEAVRRLNGTGEPGVYPGSPWLIVDALRPGDRYLGCELRADDHQRLEATLRRGARPKGVAAEARRADGYAAARAAGGEPGRRLVLIDPPFERPDDYQQAADTALAVVGAGRPRPTVTVWTPLKDLETFDAFLRRLQAGGAGSVLVAEARLRPLRDPMKMNGCAMVVLNPPAALAGLAQAVCAEVVATLGEPGAEARVWTLA